MPDQIQFRTALHGYNREDVVAFIDRMTREHEDALRRLEEKNAQLRTQLDEAGEALAAARENEETEKALSDAQALANDLRARNEELEQRLAALEEELESRTEEDAETVPMPIPQDLEEPIAPVAEVLPVEVQPSKDYTELELAAYRRAELAERLARERSGDVYRQVQSVFNQASQRLDAGKADLEQLSKTLTGNVNQMLALLTNLNSAYRQAEISFGEIGARNREIVEGND
ncbi:MAG: DivIVA domain-containing protein [Oscillospiraceae bacterium]|nr:DivIVA domain-containing protein [Oscillospiraceae bacterium]